MYLKEKLRGFAAKSAKLAHGLTFLISGDEPHDWSFALEKKLQFGVNICVSTKITRIQCV